MPGPSFCSGDDVALRTAECENSPFGIYGLLESK